MKRLLHQVLKFGLVGLLASLVHYVTAISLFKIEIVPMWANFFAFIVAFQVSFFGHYRWTFALEGVRRFTAFHRFLCVSVLGFLVNETLLFLFLRWTPITAKWALLIVLIVVAGLTFLLNRTWAFSRDDTTPSHYKKVRL